MNTIHIEFGRCLNLGRKIDWSLLYDELAVDRLYPHLRVFPRRKAC